MNVWNEVFTLCSPPKKYTDKFPLRQHISCVATQLVVSIDKESRKFTTFMSDQGKFHWNRLPMGLRVSSDLFQMKMEAALKRRGTLNNIIREVDDILIWGGSQEELDANWNELLDICREEGITLSPKKVQYAAPGEFLVLPGEGLAVRVVCSQRLRWRQ